MENLMITRYAPTREGSINNNDAELVLIAQKGDVEAFNQLQVDQRTVVVLVDLQDIDYQETAHVLGIPIGTVKSRLARGRLRLRQLLSTLGSIMQLI